ncbi:hypothetical protein H4R21_003923 [Coemansia helicoidea]|uniref:Uncharacterized protein n=1 Tax=Coemansia helicoidea TaxID=1286919 RepID=A0ACC1L0L8_9FUNG|nr:hypothetical protein H4R21_003923 [Coemansia helicoidea]
MSLSVKLYRRRVLLLVLLAVVAVCVLLSRSASEPARLAAVAGRRPPPPAAVSLPPPPPAAAGAGEDGAAGGQTPTERRLRLLIGRNRVMVFSKTYCPYSQRAKRLLEQYRADRGLEFSVLEADQDENPLAVKSALARISARSTFPNVFVDGRSIGGSDDLAQLHESGELAALLHDRGLIV